MRAAPSALVTVWLLAAWLPVTLEADEPPPDSLLDSLLAAGAAAAASVGRGLDGLEPRAEQLTTDWAVGWVRSVRDSAEARGVDTMPLQLRGLFAGQIPEEVIARARWRVDDTAISVQQGLFRSGYTTALTVDDVILFADADAAGSAVLWAHELAHVMQYADWGVDGFVERYLADASAVEHAANDLAWVWLQASTGGAPAP